MKFKVWGLFLIIVMEVVFADNDMIGAGVGVAYSPIPINKHRQTLRVTSYLYGFKLSFEQLNNVLIANNIPKISVTDKMFLKDNLQNNDIPKMDYKSDYKT